MIRSVQFETLDGRTFEGEVRNGAAPVSTIAEELARRVGISGTFELIDKANPDVSLDPETPLDELPEQVVLAPELTPAV